MVQVTGAETPKPASPQHGFCYLAIQELATRVSHLNTGKVLGDAVGYNVMARVAFDENLHFMFYRDMVGACLEADPSATVVALEQVVREFQMPGLGIPGFDRHALITESNIDAARIRSFALLSVSADGWLQDIVEKPDDETFERMGPHALVSMNLWALTTPLFDVCRQVQPSARGELELPNAVRLAVREMGMKIRVFPVTAGVLDLSSRGDVGPVADALRHITVRL